MSQPSLSNSPLTTKFPASHFNLAPASFSAIPERFMAQVAQSPDAIALVTETETLTYHQLNQKTNQLARYLKQRQIGSGDRVAVQISRSSAALIAFLGVLKAGAAYVPIETEYPSERRNYILQNAEVALLLTESALLSEVFSSAPIDANHCLCLDTAWDAIAHFSPDNFPLAVQPDAMCSPRLYIRFYGQTQKRSHRSSENAELLSDNGDYFGAIASRSGVRVCQLQFFCGDRKTVSRLDSRRSIAFAM